MYWFSELKRQLGLSYYYNIGGIIFLWSDLFQARNTGQWNMSLNYNVLFNFRQVLSYANVLNY